MSHWLRRTTVFQRIALALMVLAMGTKIFAYSSSGSPFSGSLTLAFLLCFVAFRKGLLWRVRNRLLVTFFLFGVVPIFLIGFLLMLTGELLLGQFAAQRVRQDLDARIESVRSTARNLALAAANGAKANQLDGMRAQTPRLATLVQADTHILRFPPDVQIQSVPAWISPGFADLFASGGHYYIGSEAREATTTAFVYLPLDQQTLASLTPGVVSTVSPIAGDADMNFTFGPSGNQISVKKDGVRKEVTPSRLGPRRGWWDVPIAGMLTWQVQTSAGKQEAVLPLLSRPSMLISGATTGRMESVAISVMVVVGCFFLIVETVSLFSSVRLTRTITRSVDDLYRGTLQVAEGDFSHQIPVRGAHQLSALAGSFNSMTAKIRQLIGEVKKKEKLDAELEIARQVQLRLFPRSVPKLKTLEMAGVCFPGRVVSGDYYDYVRLDGRWTAIALGDVSGKGVSAALLMASIQSALHAQLKFTAATADAPLSTATLVERIGQQLYENTPPEKYATFFCSVYDDETGRLTYTNGGHLKPILVRDGTASTLDGEGMVVGLLPNIKYDQQDILLRTGDLVAIFSDGIPEAEDAAEAEFGETRLAELLAAQGDKPLAEIITTVTGAVEKWIYDPEGRDDVTLLLLRKV